MKRLILSVLVVLAIATTVVGCGTSNAVKSPSSGNTELQGAWTETSFGVTMTFTFSGDNFTATATGSIQWSGTFTLDSTANPKTIDLYYATCTYPSDSNVGKTALGIYLRYSSFEFKYDILVPFKERKDERLIIHS